jgi:hypothetical protein
VKLVEHEKKERKNKTQPAALRNYKLSPSGINSIFIQQNKMKAV